jgi:hypothetical protein
VTLDEALTPNLTLLLEGLQTIWRELDIRNSPAPAPTTM